MNFFSVIIPLYNKEKYIADTLNSVKNQQHKEFELIIINDGSTDESVIIVESWINQYSKQLIYPVKLVHQNNQGVSVARNNAIKYANADYIALLDADDIWMPNHLNLLENLIEKFHNSVDIFSCAIAFKVNEETLPVRIQDEEGFEGVLDYLIVAKGNHGYLNSSSVCIKKSTIINVPFPEDMKFAEDLVTWASICNQQGFAFASTVTSIYRQDQLDAAVCKDFKDFIRFEKRVSSITAKKDELFSYIYNFLFFAVLTARINLSFREFFLQSFKIFGQSIQLSVYIVIASSIPKFILIFLRNKRKKRKYFGAKS
jgi:glycosyltransferase involved in cell wall biosynthesis